MDSGGGIFATRFNPFDRRAQTHGQMAAQSFFGVKVEFGTEAAADFRRDDSHFVFRDLDHARQESAHQVGNLGRSPERQGLLAGVIRSDAPAGLDGHRREPLVHHALSNYLVSLLEYRVDVTVGEGPGIGDIRAQIRMGQRGFLFHCFDRITDHRQWLVIHFD